MRHYFRNLLKNTWQAEPPAPPSLQVADLPWWRRRFRLRLQTNQTFFDKFLVVLPDKRMLLLLEILDIEDLYLFNGKPRNRVERQNYRSAM